MDAPTDLASAERRLLHYVTQVTYDRKASGDREVWIGETRTHEVAFDVVDPPGVSAPLDPKLSVNDPATGLSIGVKQDQKTLVAKDAQGKVVWEADVIAKAGDPGVGKPVIRHVSLKDGTITAVYGKHSFADFDLQTGKFLSSGSD